jgi:HK97 family phage major capsid protein
MLDFNGYGIDALLQKWASGSILRELDRLMLVGDVGAGDPYDGILNTAGVDNVALAVPGTLAYGDIRNIRAQLAAEYWGDAVYIMNQQALYQVEILEDLTGMPIWFRDPTGVRPSTIDGYPYIIDNQIPNNIGGANQSVIFFGVLGYWFQGNGGMAFSMSEHAEFVENVNVYKVTGYGDGFYALPVAMNYLEAVPV